jgi:hypothetical protein
MLLVSFVAVSTLLVLGLQIIHLLHPAQPTLPMLHSTCYQPGCADHASANQVLQTSHLAQPTGFLLEPTQCCLLYVTCAAAVTGVQAPAGLGS